MKDKFIEIYDNYKDNVYRLALSYTKNVNDAEDIVQNVFLKLIKKFNNFENEDYIKKWCFKVTVNECKTKLLSKWKQMLPINDDTEKYFYKLDKDMLDLKNAIFKLSSKQRIIIYLYYYEGYKVNEIAEILNKNSSTIQTNLNRARKSLKLLLKEGDI